MKTPLVSILVNCYNSKTYLREALDSIFAQTYTNWEVIFWDNASTDGSLEVAKSYGEKVRCFRGETTVPLYHARNLAFEKVRGDLLAICDCDDVWLPKKLEYQVPLFKNPEVGVVYSDTYFFNSKGIFRQLYKTRPCYEGSCFSELLGDYFLSLETLVFRVSLIRELTHVFDTRFQMIGDADLVRRMALISKLARDPRPLAMWRVHEESLTTTDPEKFARESRTLLRSYEETIPRFSERFGAAIEDLKDEIAYMEAKVNWKKGQRVSWSDLSPWRHKKHFLLWMLRLLPPKMAAGLLS